MPQTPPTPNRSRVTWIALVLVLGVVAALAVYFGLPSHLKAMFQAALDSIERLGIWGPVLFVMLYILASVCFGPAALLTVGAGAVFGVIRGAVFASIGSVLGATAAFLIGRYLARNWVAGKIQGRSAFEAIDQAVAEEGWKIVGLLRLSPVFPFVLLNYAFGLTRVRLRAFVLASWIGMMPGTILYVYIGSLANAGARETSPGEWALRAAGLGATILVAVLIGRIAKRALARKLPGGKPTSRSDRLPVEPRA